MRRGIMTRRSRAAGWARLAGGLALPVLVLGVAGTRLGIVPPIALQPVLVVGFLLGLLGLGLAVFSLIDIWKSGAAGAGAALAGIVYASPVIVIIGLVAAAAILYPRLTDITTDVNDPPLFTQAGAPRAKPDARSAALQVGAYPDLVARRYPLPAGAVYAAARGLMEERRWTITYDVPPPVMPETALEAPTTALVVPEDDELVKALAAKSVMTQSRGGPATETRPPELKEQPGTPVPILPATPFGEAATEEPSNVAVLEAAAPTPIFGFLDDVVVRITQTPDGTEVDMRSASRVGEHDLGQNARRIRGFFAELDAKLQPDPAAGVTSAAR